VLGVALLACRPADDPRDRPDALSAAALHDATFALTSMGARQVATPAEEEARAWLEAALREAGLQDVVSEPFTFDAWRPGTASVFAGGDSGREVPVEALSPSPAAELTLVLRGADDDFAGDVVLLSSDAFPSRADALLHALGGGAAALIRVTEEVDLDGAPLVEVGHLLDGITLPAVAVDHGTGLWLAGHLGEEVRISIAPELHPGHTSSNVAGRAPGRAEDPGRVYVVAHYDSWHPSESAFDNALGAAALVQLAEEVAGRARERAPEREIVFLATSGEEQGLQGAIAWAAQHDAEIGPADVVITLDVMWSGEGSYVAMGTDPGLVTEAIDAAAAAGLDAIDGGDPGPSSDHFPFVTRGARALWLGRWPDRHYHTVADTLDAIDFDAAEQALRTNYTLLAAHAGLDP
jgi:hypothetical protein